MAAPAEHPARGLTATLQAGLEGVRDLRAATQAEQAAQAAKPFWWFTTLYPGFPPLAQQWDLQSVILAAQEGPAAAALQEHGAILIPIASTPTATAVLPAATAI